MPSTDTINRETTLCVSLAARPSSYTPANLPPSAMAEMAMTSRKPTA